MSDNLSIQRPTGMLDVLPDERRYWDLVVGTAADLAHQYGFQQIDLPIIEYHELFTRGVGTGSDVFVQKEMYNLDEPDGNGISLRPEFTAGFVRAHIQNGMASWPQPVKLFTIGPIFRRERPQAGRYRQHSQFNAEIMGEDDPAADLEVMLLALNLYRGLGYEGLSFQLNSTGCPTCRPNYVAKLTEYLNGYLDKLAPVDKERLVRNPLRVLDSKEEGMDELLAGAPHFLNHLCEDCATHFADLLGLMDALDQPYKINFRLVRGLDYYTKTVFEVWQEGIGAQAAICGGGRYDGLAEAIGGSPTPGVGFGSGIERIILGLKQRNISPPEPDPPAILVAHFGGETKEAAAKLTFRLRTAGVNVRLAFARGRRSLKSQMREANRLGAGTVLIFGESELSEGVVAVRPLDGGEQTRIPLSDIEDRMKMQYGKK